MRPPMIYEHTDIPEGMTCREFRRRPRRPRRATGRLRALFRRRATVPS
jgi:hypothetical protein